MLHSMTIRLIHVDQLETLLWLYVVKCQSGVIWGHWGQKVIWTKNAITRPCYTVWPQDLYMFISLRPATYVMGSNVNLGSFGVIGVKFWFSLKIHYSYVTKYFHVILTFASHLRDKQGNWGQSGVDVSKPAGYAVCDGNMSSFFFLLATLLRLIASTCFDRFQPDLVIRTPDTWHLCHMTTVGSKIT